MPDFERDCYNAEMAQWGNKVDICACGIQENNLMPLQGPIGHI